MPRIYLALTYAMALVHVGCSADTRTRNSAPSTKSTNTSPLKPGIKIRLKIEHKILAATLVDSKTTRDFVSVLALTLTMNALLRSDKFVHLPRAVCEQRQRTRTYEIRQ